jgi:Ni/Co efflux regulator RcnB
MNVYKAGLVLALCAGVGALTAAPSALLGQDRGQQDQRGGGDRGRGNQGQRNQGHGDRGRGSQGNRGRDGRPGPQQNEGRGPQGDRGRGPEQASRGRGFQGRPDYQFRGQDVSRLRQYYGGRLGRIDRRRRAYFAPGGYIPGYYRGYFRPVPPGLLGYLPPPPPGYAIGYYNGYCVVYNPATYLIASVLNLLP